MQTGPPDLPGLFGYLLLVTAAALMVMRLTAWTWLGWATCAAGAAWVVLAAGAEGEAWAPGLFVPAAALLYAGWRSWPYPIEQHYATPDTRVRLVAGDLFEQDCNLVIGMSDTFDVETPHIIATSSVQGQFLERIYCQDVAALRKDVASALSAATPVGRIQKAGNQDKYACYWNWCALTNSIS